MEKIVYLFELFFIPIFHTVGKLRSPLCHWIGVYVGIVSITFDENNVLGSNPNDFGAICQRQIFHMIFLQFADKDNTNERNES